jgi:hypothetical protein
MPVEKNTPEIKAISVQNNDCKLFKEVTSSTVPHSTEKLFYVNKNTGKIYERKPIFFQNDLTYYIVNSDEEFSYRGLKKEISELDNSYIVNVIINYKIKIKNNPSIDLVRLLMSENSIEKVLNNKILRWVNDFASNEPTFIKRFFSLQKQFIKYIEDQSTKLGISIELAISLDERETISKPINFSGNLSLRVYDYFGQVPLSYNLELEAILEKQDDARVSLFNKNVLKEGIENAIKTAIQSNEKINLHFLYYKLQNEIRETIFRKLETYLDKFGFKPAFINMDIQLQNLPPQREQLEYSIKCVIKGKYDVTVNHNLILNLKNLGTYFSSNVMNLNDSVKQELERITQDYLFDQEFTSLATQFDSQLIKDEMSKEMDKIGYEVKQLITVPKLEGIIPDYFSFEVGKDCEFATQQDDVRVKLNIIVSGKIKDVDVLKKYLNPSVTSENIIEKMKDAVVNTTRHFLHGIDPERFYMRFDYSGESKELPLSELLKSKLIEMLSNEFGGDTLEIIPKQMETDLVIQLKKIRGVSYSFVFQNFSRFIIFECTFNVVGVAKDGWYLFKAKCDANVGKDDQQLLQEISQTMKNYIEMHLDTFSAYDFKIIKDIGFMKQIYELLHSSISVVQTEYGLIVQVSQGLKRLPSPLEKKLQEKQEVYDDTRKLEIDNEIKKLEIIKTSEREKIKLLLDKEKTILQNEDLDEQEISDQLQKLLGNETIKKPFDELKEMEINLQSSSVLNLFLSETSTQEASFED